MQSRDTSFCMVECCLDNLLGGLATKVKYNMRTENIVFSVPNRLGSVI